MCPPLVMHWRKSELLLCGPSCLSASGAVPHSALCRSHAGFPVDLQVGLLHMLGWAFALACDVLPSGSLPGLFVEAHSAFIP